MENPRSILNLPSLALEWRRVAPGSWLTSFAGEDCSLTMNDFPDEPLYTVRAFGESVDLDDPPIAWTLEMPELRREN